MKDELKYLDSILFHLAQHKTEYISLVQLCKLVDKVEINGNIQAFREPAPYIDESHKDVEEHFADLMRYTLFKVEDALKFLEQEDMVYSSTEGYRITFKGLIQLKKSYYKKYSSKIKKSKLKNIYTFIRIISLVVSFLTGVFVKDIIQTLSDLF